MLMHHKLILLLVGLGITWFLTIKLSILFIVPAIVLCGYIPVITSMKDLLKIILPVTILLTIAAFLIAFMT